jgi:uncharacterized membrane protein YphA (DoxX/SURF4 family)
VRNCVVLLCVGRVCVLSEDSLQRLFSTFPSGRPGLGLLLLRATSGGVAAAIGALYLSGLIERTVAVWTIGAILVGCGAALVVGFLTPLASMVVGLCGLGISFSWFPVPPFASLAARAMTLVFVVTTVGISLLGPGAFSLDGYLFGRREIVIPPRAPER